MALTEGKRDMSERGGHEALKPATGADESRRHPRGDS